MVNVDTLGFHLVLQTRAPKRCAAETVSRDTEGKLVPCLLHSKSVSRYAR